MSQLQLTRWQTRRQRRRYRFPMAGASIAAMKLCSVLQATGSVLPGRRRCQHYLRCSIVSSGAAAQAARWRDAVFLRWATVRAVTELNCAFSVGTKLAIAKRHGRS